MPIIINNKNIFNECMLKDLEMIEYYNYKEDFIIVEYETFRHFEMLKSHLKVENIIIDIDNAYRSLETQENILLNEMIKYKMDLTKIQASLPGTTEHHLGQAIDIALYINNEWVSDKNKLFKETKKFKKIHKSLKYFGFILRYPLNKENITNHQYSPWHIRYVGEDIAKDIDELTLEEYKENVLC